jgi:hypothetical protein
MMQIIIKLLNSEVDEDFQIGIFLLQSEKYDNSSIAIIANAAMQGGKYTLIYNGANGTFTRLKE